MIKVNGNIEVSDSALYDAMLRQFDRQHLSNADVNLALLDAVRSTVEGETGPASVQALARAAAVALARLAEFAKLGEKPIEMLAHVLERAKATDRLRERNQAMISGRAPNLID